METLGRGHLHVRFSHASQRCNTQLIAAINKELLDTLRPAISFSIGSLFLNKKVRILLAEAQFPDQLPPPLPRNHKSTPQRLPKLSSRCRRRCRTSRKRLPPHSSKTSPRKNKHQSSAPLKPPNAPIRRLSDPGHPMRALWSTWHTWNSRITADLGRRRPVTSQ